MSSDPASAPLGGLGGPAPIQSHPREGTGDSIQKTRPQIHVSRVPVRRTATSPERHTGQK